MITNRQRYEARHRKFMLAAETEFLELRRGNPTFTIEKAITGLAARVKLAIVRRDARAGLIAAQIAHIAVKFRPVLLRHMGRPAGAYLPLAGRVEADIPTNTFISPSKSA